MAAADAGDVWVVRSSEWAGELAAPTTVIADDAGLGAETAAEVIRAARGGLATALRHAPRLAGAVPGIACVAAAGEGETVRVATRWGVREIDGPGVLVVCAGVQAAGPWLPPLVEAGPAGAYVVELAGGARPWWPR